MTNRYPLIIDVADGNKIKELPQGDNLNLSGSNLVNVINVTASGTLTASDVVVGGSSIQPIAFSGSFNDLTDVPTGFSGSYDDLSDKPSIASTTRQLTDVLDVEPENNQALIYNVLSGKFEPKDLVSAFDLSDRFLNELKDVVATGVYTDSFLKFYSGAWRPAKVTWAEIQNKPTNISVFTNDAGYLNTAGTINLLSTNGYLKLSDLTDGTVTVDVNNTGDLTGSVFGDDSTLLVDSTSSELVGPVSTPSLKINNNIVPITGISDDDTLSANSSANLTTEFAVKSYVDSAIASFDSVGNFSFTDSNIDTTDSSAITITPAVIMNSDLTVENDLTVRNDLVLEGTISGDGSGTPELFSEGDIRLTADTVIIDGDFQITGQIETTGTGAPELVSDTDIQITAETRVEITSSPFKVASFTTAQRDALTPEVGDIIFNAETGTFQGYIISVVDSTQKWVDLSPEE